MPNVYAPGLVSALDQVTKAWKMSFQSVHFLLFLPVVAGGYFLLPQKARRAWLLLASYYFYFFAAPRYLPILLLGTVLSWALGLFAAKAPMGKTRTRRLVFSVGALVLLLCFFKYNGMFATVLSPAFAAVGVDYNRDFFTTAGALGISFYTFTAVGYLIDVARGDVPAERNLLNYALFLGFFPSVTMGPISRAGALMPQLLDTARGFDRANAKNALRLMACGFFKKMAVSNTIALFVNHVYGANLAQYGGLTLIAANATFALQLYFDFSGYTDIARGTAGLLGITLPENFSTPYYATNFSGFWQRWHISLSTWLQDYVFTPLVWSRWTEKLPFIGKRVQKPPVLSSLAITFVLSGLWHGDTACYLVWGALQAAFRIGEELFHRTLGKPQKHPGPLLKTAKMWAVRILWMQSLIFFKVGLMNPDLPDANIAGAFGAVLRQLPGFAPAGSFAPLSLWRVLYDAIYYGLYNHRFVVYGFLGFAVICLVAACLADRYQYKKLGGKPFAVGLAAFPGPVRWAIYYLMVGLCFGAFLFQSGGFSSANFIYGGY